jgi:hypothetical protein
LFVKKNANFFAENLEKIAGNCDYNIDPSKKTFENFFMQEQKMPNACFEIRMTFFKFILVGRLKLKKPVLGPTYLPT